MGTMTINGVPFGDDGRQAYLDPETLAAFRADDAERARRSREGIDRILAEVSAKARAMVRGPRNIVNQRARTIRRWPTQLDAVPGLSAASSIADILAATASQLEHAPRRRWEGMGGEVPLVTLRAARLYARWLRLWERDQARKFAAGRVA